MKKHTMRLPALAAAAMTFAAFTAAMPAFAEDDDAVDQTRHFVATASGAQETTPSTSDARVRISVRFDAAMTRADVVLRVRGINSQVVAAHLHCNRAGLNGPPAFGIMNPGQLTEIGANTRLTLTNADAVADCTPTIGRPVNNIASLYQAMKDGLIYLNIHTPDYPPGEVRGQLMEAAD